jgi:hypothetical protein
MSSAANKVITARAMVDLLNGCLLLINLECNWFESQGKMAWESDSILTSKRVDKKQSIMEEISEMNFKITVVEQEDSWKFLVVLCNSVGSICFTCIFAEEVIMGLILKVALVEGTRHVTKDCIILQRRIRREVETCARVVPVEKVEPVPRATMDISGACDISSNVMG